MHFKYQNLGFYLGDFLGLNLYRMIPIHVVVQCRSIQVLVV